MSFLIELMIFICVNKLTMLMPFLKQACGRPGVRGNHIGDFCLTTTGSMHELVGIGKDLETASPKENH